MSYEQFAKWVAYSELEPFGEVMADMRAGVLASVVASGHSATRRAIYATHGKRLPPDRIRFTPETFIPWLNKSLDRSEPFSKSSTDLGMRGNRRSKVSTPEQWTSFKHNFVVLSKIAAQGKR